jgi:hypothetical protein
MTNEQEKRELYGHAFDFYDSPLKDGGRVACHCGRCGWKAYALNYGQAKDILDAHEQESHGAGAIGSKAV